MNNFKIMFIVIVLALLLRPFCDKLEGVDLVPIKDYNTFVTKLNKDGNTFPGNLTISGFVAFPRSPTKEFRVYDFANEKGASGRSFNYGFSQYYNVSHSGYPSDYIHLNTYDPDDKTITDQNVKNANIIALQKNGIGMRIYQAPSDRFSDMGKYHDVVTYNNTDDKFYIQGNEFANLNKNISKNIAQYIVVGNMHSPNWQDYFTLIEIDVLDVNGVHVSLGKKVTLKHGNTTLYDTNTKIENVVNGQVFDTWKLEDNLRFGMHGNMGQYEFEIDLLEEKNIGLIILYGRYHKDYTHRLNGTTVELLDENRKRRRIIHTGIWNGQYSKEYTL